MLIQPGDLLHPGRTFYDAVGPQWKLTSEPLVKIMSLSDDLPFEVADVHIRLVEFLPSPSAEDIAPVVNNEPMQFALIPGQHAMMLAYRFGNGLWSDGSWQACLQDEDAGLPDVGDTMHLVVSVFVVDPGTGIVAACKYSSWPPPFVQAVRDAIATQARNGNNKQAGINEILSWVTTYQHPNHLVQARASIIVDGGKDGRIIRHT